MVRELIALGADVHQVTNDGRTALYVAARNNNIEMVKKLIGHGVDVHQVSDDGKTALDWAVTNYNIWMVRDLIAHGADETSLNEEQQTQFAEAIAEGKAILIRNTKSSACALADTGQELQRVSIIQDHPCRSQQHENKLPGTDPSIIAQIASFAAELQMPNSLTQEQITKCAEVGAHSVATTDMLGFFHHETKFVARDPGNTINNILNGNQNPANGQGLGG